MGNSELRDLVGYMLGQLLQKDSSVEVGVRNVLRISTTRSHSEWIAWSILQLADMSDEAEVSLSEALDAIGHVPTLQQQHEVIKKALKAYNYTREGVGDAPPHHADIKDVERDAEIFEAELKRSITDLRFRQLAVRHRILNRVKNKVQEYLMKFEATGESADIGEE